MSVFAHVLVDSSLFVKVMPLERLDLSLCVRERKKQRGRRYDSFISLLFQTSIRGQRRKTQVCVRASVRLNYNVLALHSFNLT